MREPTEAARPGTDTDAAPNGPASGTRTVEGQVRDRFGNAVAGALVRVVAQRLRRPPAVLGTTAHTGTGPNLGRYTVTYPAPDAGFALVVEASLDGAAPTRSAPTFDPPLRHVVDLVLGEGGRRTADPTYVRLATGTDQALGAPAASITPEDLAPLVVATGADPEGIALLATAGRLADEASALAPGVDAAVVRPLLFALLSVGFPADLDGLLGRGAEVNRDALRTAIDAGVIPGLPDDALADGVALLDRVARANVLATRPGALGALPTVAALSPAARTLLLDRHAALRGDPARLWTDLAARPEFPAATLAKLRLEVRLNQVTRGHLPLVNLVSRADTTVETLAAQTPAEWRALVAAVPTPRDRVPAWITGASEDARLAAFADFLQRQFEAALPVAAFAGRAAKDRGLPGRALISAFLTNVAAAGVPFELGSTSPEELRADPEHARTAFAGLDPDATTRAVKALQRVFRIAPRYDPAAALLKDHLDAAVRVVRVGRTAFANRYATAFGGRAEAEAGYRRAEHAVATAQTLFGIHNATLAGPPIPVLGTAPATVPGLPHWSALFRDQPFCDCAECRTVLSPAAYLVDLLAFLRDRPAMDGGSALDVLLGRRPDLGTLELSCANTTVALPTIDLVTELLEDALAPPIPHDRTTGDALERSISPEYVNEAASARLATLVYPWNLPFDLAHATTVAFLGHLGVARDELMAAFRPATGSPAPLADDELRAEHLGLPPAHWRLVADPQAAGGPELWGLPAATWLTRLASAEEFLARSGLSFDELVALLATDVAGGRVRLVRPAAGGSLGEVTLEGLNEADAVAIARFLRLRSALGWSIAETDRAARALRYPAENDAAALVDLHRVAAAADRPLAEVLPWFSDLDTRTGPAGRPSPYDHVYRNHPQAAAFALDPTGTELADPGGPLLPHAAALRAALGLTTEELSVLVPDRVPNVLTLGTLSTLYGYVTLAGALGTDLTTTVELAGLVDFGLPVDRRSPDRAREFLTTAREILDCGFPLATLRALLHQPDEPHPGDPGPDAALLQELRRPGASVESVVQRLADAYAVSAAMARRLATEVVREPGGGRTAADVLLDPASGPTAAAVLAALERAARLAAGLRLDAEDVPFVLAAGAASGFDPALRDTVPAAVARLLRTVAWVRLRDRLTPGSTALFALAAADRSAAGLRADLAAATGWDADELARVAADLTDVADWPRIERCFHLLHRLGSSAAQAHAWAAPSVAPADARAAEQVARARHTATNWPGVARPIRDALRKRRRAALTAAVRQVTGETDDDALYGRLLADPGAGTTQTTSRIRLAIGSVQLFVQRCLSGQEPRVVLDQDAVEAWASLERYRVWEAGRRTFLYPENYLRPELRADRTPLFDQFSDALLQGEPTSEVAAAAFLAYAEGLDEVSRLDVRGAYHEVREEQGSQVDLLHVVARTFTLPAVHYYRRRVNAAVWTPWERIDVEIGKVDQVIPVVAHGRLLVYWPVFGEVTAAPAADGSARSQTTLTLAWTERTAAGWLPVRTGTREWLAEPGAQVTPSALWFRTALDDVGALVIRFGTAHGPGGEFVQDAGLGDLLPRPYSDQAGFRTPLMAPPRTRSAGMGFQEVPQPVVVAEALAAAGTRIPVPDAVPGRFTGTTAVPFEDSLHLPTRAGTVRMLGRTPGRFTLLPLHQYARFDGRDVFLYADDGRTFLITPQTRYRYDWAKPSRFDLGLRELPTSYRTPPGPAWERPPVAAPPAVVEAAATRPGERTTVVDTDRFTFPGTDPAGNLVAGYRRAIALLTVPRSGSAVAVLAPPGASETAFGFQAHQHPFTAEFLRRLRSRGVPGLLGRNDGAAPAQWLRTDYFAARYAPEPERWWGPAPVDEVDFSGAGPYSAYNWELFVHAPLLVAQRLSANQRHAEAQSWLHYLFDPRATEGAAPERYWLARPLREAAASVGADLPTLLGLLSGPSTPESMAARTALREAIEAWRASPFDPDAVARLRIAAYQKAIVLTYLENLLAWGDHLFRQNTQESVAEAASRYLLAAALLGPRPVAVPPAEPIAPRTYRDLEADLDDFSNALVELENLLPTVPGEPEPVIGGGGPALLLGTTLYFSVPPNPALTGYWDLIADRMAKIRASQDIDGRPRTLELFDSPRDPALSTTAAGLSTGPDALAPLPAYRFATLLAKAVEFTGDVRALGAQLLAALGNRDAERLSELRQTHERGVLTALRQSRVEAVVETEQGLTALGTAHHLAQLRRDHYRGLEPRTAREQAQLRQARLGALFRGLGQLAQGTAGLLHALPDLEAGVVGVAPTATVRHGGSHLGAVAAAGAAALGALGDKYATQSLVNGILAAFDRREEEWGLQADLAETELVQIEAQQAAAAARAAAARRELAAHDLRISQAEQVAGVLSTRFTNAALFDWMVGQLSAAYFQAYQVAYDLARAAERAFRHELARPTATFVQPDTWDTLTRGLLAGDRLHGDLRRMEAAYLAGNVRELELTRHVSLALIDPLALVTLVRTGSCFIDLPESLFDADYPGHHLRRLRSVALTIPCVTGPYTGVNATLTLVSSTVRQSPSVEGGYRRSGPTDPRFVDGLLPATSIVTSSGQADTGQFEQNLRDERYLPFEGGGAVSRWQLELPALTNRFDPHSVSDVLLHLRYTARDGGPALRTAATAMVAAERDGVQFFSARQSFPDAWYRFLHGSAEGAAHDLDLDLGADRFPFRRASTGPARVVGLDLFLRVTPDTAVGAGLPVELYAGPEPTAPDLLANRPLTADEDVYRESVTPTGGRPTGHWLLRIRPEQLPPALRDPNATPARLNTALVQDLYLVCRFTTA